MIVLMLSWIARAATHARMAMGPSGAREGKVHITVHFDFFCVLSCLLRDLSGQVKCYVV